MDLKRSSEGASSTNPNLKPCGEANKGNTRHIRDYSDPEKDEKYFSEKVDNISSHTCPDDGNDPEMENDEKSVKTENDRSGTSDRNDVTDFMEKADYETDKNQAEKMEITNSKIGAG